MRQEQIPQAGSARLGLELFNQSGGNPRVAFGPVFGNFAEETGFVRVNVFIHELQQLGLQFFYFGAVVKVHVYLRQ